MYGTKGKLLLSVCSSP